LEGEEITLVGTIRGLPRRDAEDAHFEFVVQRATQNESSVPFTGVVRLSWYRDAPELAPCQTWTLRAHLKRPRGMIDPGVFDFERYALSEGINATGYARESDGNRNIGDAMFCVDRFRARILEGISATLGDEPSAHLLRALAFGDQRAMDEHEWAVARATGIPHLIAISGLHIALFAGFGVLLIRLLWRAIPSLTLRLPAPLIEATASLVFAIAYAIIAGLGLPTRRALVMIGVILAANFARRARASVQGLAFAVIALIAWDPLCVLSAGFWLSFVGVAWLMFCLDGGRHGWRDLVKAQGVASIGLLPLSIWFFGQSSLIGPIANLVAVPLICFAILPVTVVGALLQLAMPTLGGALVQLAGWMMQMLWWLLEHMAQWPGALWYFAEPSLLALALAMIGAFWLLTPRGMHARCLGVFLFLPLLFPNRPELADGEFETLMLDVGQGLAIVVRTREHTLLYDAGARYPSGFDLGDAVVVPTLHALGIAKLDRLIISHGDNDHAGGAASVDAAFPKSIIESGEPERLNIAASQCVAGEHWNWNGVEFRVVHPTAPLSSRSNNDRCCVIEIQSGDSTLLLTGDISAAVEPQIATAIPASPYTVLQVPHHGSKTSSSDELLNALRPRLALASAGYRNRFNHPNPEIVARYATHGIELVNTAMNGFIDIRFKPDDAPTIVERGRPDRHPYWRE
jgi:competence protein ComEC